jgi:hypothetical protein
LNRRVGIFVQDFDCPVGELSSQMFEGAGPSPPLLDVDVLSERRIDFEGNTRRAFRHLVEVRHVHQGGGRLTLGGSISGASERIDVKTPKRLPLERLSVSIQIRA